MANIHTGEEGPCGAQVEFGIHVVAFSLGEGIIGVTATTRGLIDHPESALTLCVPTLQSLLNDRIDISTFRMNIVSISVVHYPAPVLSLPMNTLSLQAAGHHLFERRWTFYAPHQPGVR